jgi:hypothetical protein
VGPRAGLDVSEKRKLSYLFFHVISPRLLLNIKVKVKLKFTLEQATEAQRGSSGIALLFLNLDARREWWSTPRPGRFTPGRDPVPNV